MMISASPASSPPFQDETGKKDLSIETLRGIAILLVVASHSILAMRVRNDSFFNYFYVTTLPIRMPVFAAIAGYVYSRRPVAAGRVMSFLRGKARRIVLPFLTVGTARSVAHHFHHGGTIAELPRAVIEGIVFTRDEFWFLQSAALCFLLVAILERAGALSTLKRWLAVLVGIAALRYVIPKPPVFSFDGFLFLIPFFLLGCGLPRFARSIFRTPVLIVGWAAFLCGLANQQLRWWVLGDHHVNWGVVFETLPLCFGLGTILLAFQYRRPVLGLARLGSHAFPIYLFHSFALSFCAVVFDVITPIQRDWALVLFPIYLAVGLSASIVVEGVMKRHRLTRLLILGLGATKPPHAPKPDDGTVLAARVATAI